MVRAKQTKNGVSTRLLIAIAVVLVLVIAALVTLLVLEANGVFYDAKEEVVITPPKIVTGYFKDGDYQYSLLEDGTAILRVYEGTDKALIEVPQALGGYKVSAIGEIAFSSTDGIIKEIRLPEGITYIGKGAFSGIENAKLYLPSTIEQIDNMALYGFENPAGIYFAGTKEQWESVKVGTDNKVLVNVICEK